MSDTKPLAGAALPAAADGTIATAIAIVVLTEGGLATARRIQQALPDASIHGLAARVSAAQIPFEQAGSHLRALFAAGTAIIGVCATGILVRSLAPSLDDKHSEPPVIAVAENGSAVVPVLGGHRGANRLAERVAGALDTRAAITTATDARWRVALDAPPPGWVLANPQHHKAFAAALLAGEGCRLDVERPPEGCVEAVGVEAGGDPTSADAAWLTGSGIEFTADGTLCIQVCDAPRTGDEQHLVYHRRRFALGVGCERGTSGEELLELVQGALAAAGLTPSVLAGLYSLDLKCDEPAVHAVAQALQVPARFYAAHTLEAETPRLRTPSEVVFAEVGCHGVSEGAALAAAGPGGVLVLAERKSARATCAIAMRQGIIDPSSTGRPRGSLTVVGLGPGSAATRTPEADAAIRAAEHLVGYSGYLDMLDPLTAAQSRHAYPLGEETGRVDHALDLAAHGARVALICSGDPGVYAMAALVFERLERSPDAGWQRSEVKVLPGVSAMHAAAARAGAPLGHDFCAISLSDLLTPWAAIEGRLRAAAAGDFVVALYNPASMRRRRQLAQAVEILAAARGADTPVVVARQVGRPEEQVSATTLGQLDQDGIDMMTVLIIGSTETRRLPAQDGVRVYTPRGYAAKSTAEQQT